MANNGVEVDMGKLRGKKSLAGPLKELIASLPDIPDAHSSIMASSRDPAIEYASGIEATLMQGRYREHERIRRCLQKYEQGSYGQCDGCRVEIPLARMKAIPSSIHCTTCAPKAGEDPLDARSLPSGPGFEDDYVNLAHIESQLRK